MIRRTGHHTDDAPKKLYRSGENKIIAGICGGIGDYFNLDATVIRLLWVLLTFAGGMGLLLYIVAWAIIPRNPGHKWD